MSDFEPELGQILFGQPYKEYEVSSIVDAALTFIRERLQTVLWNRLQEEPRDPFSNSGARFDTEGLSIHAYSWGDDDQPWNFKCGDVEISWYKYLGRGMSANREISPAGAQELLTKCLAILDAIDGPLDGPGQDFTLA